MGPRMTFNVGEKIVYPNHGVAVIENISTRSFGPRPERFYLLRLSCNNMTVMVPFSHVDDVGLRKVTKNPEIARVLCYLATGACKPLQDWKDRYKENCEKMKSGGLLEIAEVLKTLLVVQAERPLSFREKKMLDRARQMVLTEICISRGLQEGTAIELLDGLLAKSSLKMPAAL
jgi:CarD family transcriptional regulator